MNFENIQQWTIPCEGMLLVTVSDDVKNVTELLYAIFDSLHAYISTVRNVFDKSLFAYIY
jgi:hypothetical protein